MIKIYGKPNCAYCIAAKQLLDNNEIPYVYEELGVTFAKEELSAIAPAARSFPVIVVDGRYIGGYTALNAQLASIKESVGLSGPEFLAD